MPPELELWISAANSLSLTGLLVVFILMFKNGEIIPRQTYEDLTTRIIAGMLTQIKEIMREVMSEVTDRLSK